jgi:hypothetical protein
MVPPMTTTKAGHTMTMVRFPVLIGLLAVAAQEACYEDGLGRLVGCPDNKFCGVDYFCYERSCQNYYEYLNPLYDNENSSGISCEAIASDETTFIERLIDYGCENQFGEPIYKKPNMRCSANPHEGYHFICYEFSNQTTFDNFLNKIEANELPCESNETIYSYIADFRLRDVDPQYIFKFADTVTISSAFWNETYAIQHGHFGRLFKNETIIPPTASPTASSGLGIITRTAVLVQVIVSLLASLWYCI